MFRINLWLESDESLLKFSFQISESLFQFFLIGKFVLCDFRECVAKLLDTTKPLAENCLNLNQMSLRES